MKISSQMGNYTIEAIKITLFCLFVTGLFKIAGIANDDLLIIFNIAVMSAATTFSPERTELSHAALGSATMVAAITCGGLVGFYLPNLANLLTIIFAGLAFLLPKTKLKTNIFVTGTVMFLVFSYFSFDVQHALKYCGYGIIIISLFSTLTHIENIMRHQVGPVSPEPAAVEKKLTALIAVTALSLAWLASYCLKIYSSITHLYWIGLTVLVVIQGTQQSHITTAMKRIIVNVCGAFIIVILFNYLMPEQFLPNFIMLTLLLFLIFAFGFSYFLRTLFIEMFVLGFTHLLGDYQDIIAIDRVILTTIGGGLVIITTLCLYRIKSCLL